MTSSVHPSLLVSYGLQVNARDVHGYTALHYAAEESLYATSSKLLSLGADAHSVSDKGETVLHSAAQFSAGKFADNIIKIFLLDHDVNLSAKDWRGYTALHYAARDLQAVQFLVQQGADPLTLTNNRETVLRIASFRGLPSIGFFLEQGVDIHARASHYETVLHRAASAHTVNIITLLLEQGSDIHAIDSRGRTVLHCAAAVDNWRWFRLETLKLLIAHGALPNLRDASGKTALDILRAREFTGNLISTEYRDEAIHFLSQYTSS